MDWKRERWIAKTESIIKAIQDGSFNDSRGLLFYKKRLRDLKDDVFWNKCGDIVPSPVKFT